MNVLEHDMNMIIVYYRYESVTVWLVSNFFMAIPQYEVTVSG